VSAGWGRAQGEREREVIAEGMEREAGREGTEAHRVGVSCGAWCIHAGVGRATSAGLRNAQRGASRAVYDHHGPGWQGDIQWLGDI
jgi:hypothetical protein